MFDITNKIALVTGGASGIGAECVKELLRSGARGVTVVDVKLDLDSTTVKELINEFGSKKLLFVKTNVKFLEQLEDAFKKTVETFGNIDILVNNAGISNDLNYQEEIAVNITGVVHGILLGFEKYIPKFKSGEEGIIVNVASVAGLEGAPNMPIYTSTKFALIGMTKSWGCKIHYDRTKVKVLALCPGLTDTPIMDNFVATLLGEPYKKISEQIVSSLIGQTAEDCGKRISEIIRKGETGSVWVVENAEPAYEVIHPDRNAMRK